MREAQQVPAFNEVKLQVGSANTLYEINKKWWQKNALREGMGLRNC